MARLISWWSLTGEKRSLEDLRTVLREYRLHSILQGFARISVKLRTWENSSTPESDAGMVREMFPPEWVPRIEAQRDGSPGSKVFHRITVLFLIKQALMICPAGGIDVGPEHVYKVSSCFLLANDLVLGYEPLPTDTLDQLMAGLMPFYELTPQQAFPEDLIRTLILWEEILPRFRSDARFIDLPALFQERVKISFQQFCQLSLGTTIKPLLAEQQGDLLTDNFFLSPTYFSQTVVPSGEVQRFLELVSTSEEDIKRAFLSATAPTDMTPIQRRPLLRLNDGRFLVLDTAFLLDKTGPGVFWTMRDFLDRKEADRAFEFRGVLLEAYAHWFWKEDYQGSGRYTPNVHFGDGAEAFDAVLIEDGVLIVLEYKSGALPAPAKHSFDEAKLVEAIGQKYVRSEKGERKGVLQLQQNIIRFLKGEELNEIGLSRSDVHTIHPMIVAVDSSLTSPLVGNHLDLKLERGVIRKLNRRIALAPLQLATFADLERLLPYTVSVSFTRMLETATKSKFQAGNFRQRARRSIEKAQSGRDIVKERWMTLTDGMRQLFPA